MHIVPNDHDGAGDGRDRHRANHRMALLALCAATAILGGCNAQISEPWVSGQQAQALEEERTRSADQKQELTHRLQRYASAYR